MSMNNRKIAGFMSAEGIYSLAFYIVMVATIAGVGAGVMAKKDSAKAASAISLLRANYMAESGTLGYSPIPGATELQRLSGNLLSATAVLPGDVAVVTVVPRTGGTPAPAGFGINVTGLTKPEICNTIGGVGFGTWAANTTAALTAAGSVTTVSASAIKAACALAAPASAAVTLGFLSN